MNRIGLTLLSCLVLVVGLTADRAARADHHPHRVFLHHHLVKPGAWPHDPHIPYVRQWPHPGPLDAGQYGPTSPFPGPSDATWHYYAYPPYPTYNTGIGGIVPTYPYPATWRAASLVAPAAPLPIDTGW